MKSVCLIGIGNPLRGDDAVGEYVCSAIDNLCLPGVTVQTSQQLDAGIIEWLFLFDHIVIVDASLEEGVRLYPVISGLLQKSSSSHHATPELIASLAETLFHRQLSLMVCSVGASTFGTGDGLSDLSRLNAEKAISGLVQQIREWQA